jgi:hypothetical protein
MVFGWAYGVNIFSEIANHLSFILEAKKIVNDG